MCCVQSSLQDPVLPQGPPDPVPRGEQGTGGEAEKKEELGPPVTKKKNPYCDFCLGDDVMNHKSGKHERMVSCTNCGRSGRIILYNGVCLFFCLITQDLIPLPLLISIGLCRGMKGGGTPFRYGAITSISQL